MAVARERQLAVVERLTARLSSDIEVTLAGPALTTPAERAWLRTSGADVYVQGLAGPLLACAHAGISTLTLVAVTDDGEGPTAMVELVQRAEALAPQLETLIAELTPDLVRAADELQQELE